MSLFLASVALASTLVPLNDLGPAPYAYGYFGGLWIDGSNTIPADHLAAGLTESAKIQPLDRDGNPAPDGKIVVLAIGSGDAMRVFCGADTASGCDATSFTALAASDPRVEHDKLVFVNGAADGVDALQWFRPIDPTYDRVRNLALSAAGVSEKQVQVAWVDLADDNPAAPLPIQDGDAYRLKGSIANALRSMKTRYPNLRVAYLSSRVYGGYSTMARNPEPYAYESAFSVRWIVVGQVLTVRQQDIGPYWDTRIGDINYNRGSAPWVTWGPYLWADGTTPRSDGLTWNRDDFTVDGETLSATGAAKGAALLLRFFLHEPTAASWFRSGQPVTRGRAAPH